MRLALAGTVMVLLSAVANADPIYLDQLIETPLDALQTHFPGLRSNGCYEIDDGRFLLIDIDAKERKPWRVVISAAPPCRRPQKTTSPLDVQERQGINLGQTTPEIVKQLGRPDASASPETSLSRLGEVEYFYICRVDEGCARHKSVFVRNGVVTAIAEWYSE